jgi:hypothetical protein
MTRLRFVFLATCCLALAGAVLASLPAGSQSPGIHVTGIYDAGFYTKNLAVMGAFYDKLGLRREISNPNIIVYNAGSQDFAIVQSDAAPAGPMGAVTFYVNDLQSVVATLKQAQIPYDGPKPEHAYLMGVEVVDPNGNKIDFDLPRR